MQRRSLLWGSRGGRALPSLLSIAWLAGACTINPVTGDRELALISAADEVAIGTSQYQPSRQMQGGDYVLDPALTRYVAGVGARLAAVSDRALPYEFTVLDNSVPNAWALPGGKIAVNRGLLVELDSEAELAAVLGHEIVHAAARHGALAMQRGLLLQGALLAAAVAADRNNYSNLVVGAASLGAQLITQRYSRGAELESDRYGMEYMSAAGYDPAAAITLQETFVRLAEGRADSGWFAGLFASHPPSTERVERNRETASRLPAGGEVGRERYAAATARLRETRAGYDAYDRGRAALREDRVDDALALAQEALRAEPNEGHFHALLGDIERRRQRNAAAADHYRAAIMRNPRFFYYPLQLGLTLRDQGDLDGAERYLGDSLMLLPTADAHLGLGRIAEQRGDIVDALEHYRAAAGASSPAGEAAQDAVVRIDLPQNPSTYLQVRSGLDAQGMLRVEIANPTRVAVSDIGIVIRYVTAAGQATSVRRVVTTPLPPNGVQAYNTGLGPFTNESAYEVTLDTARTVAD
jgi:predicted Zn-dependent protease